MKSKNLLFHGLISAFLASFASIIYLQLYNYLMLVKFEKVINEGSIIAACLIGSMLMTMAYWLVFKFKKMKLLGVVNLLITIGSFASIIPIFTMELPLDIEFPELFPGLVIPMHFFPFLSFLSILPFFKLVHDEHKK